MIGTGCEQLDKMLGGGIPEGAMSAIFGCWKIGKTLLALQTACKCSIENKCKVLYLDSVPGYTPIMVRDELNRIDILPISELATFETKGLEKQKTKFLIHKSRDNWDEVKYVLRHPHKGKLLSINTTTGVVHTSPNHSLISGDGRGVIDARDVKKGDKLFQTKMPLNQRDSYFRGTKDLAWVFGLIAAEGSIRTSESYLSRHSNHIVINNNNKKILERAQRILERNFNLKFSFGDYEPETSKIWANNKYLARDLRKMFYTKDGEKRVPKEILNAPREIQLEFLRGAQAGDGHRNPKFKYELQNLNTSSQVLGCGYSYLIHRLGLRASIQTREDKATNMNFSINTSGKSKGSKKDDKQINKIFSFDYNGFLYDLETVSHRFNAGVGQIRVHNSEAFFNAKDVQDKYLSFFNKRFGGKAQIDFEFVADAFDFAALFGREIVLEGKGDKMELVVKLKNRPRNMPIYVKCKKENYGMVIIDSFSNPIATLLASGRRQDFPARANLVKSILGSLMVLAADLNIPVLQTTHESKDPTNVYDTGRPVLGSPFGYGVKTIFQLRYSKGKDHRKATLFRAPGLMESKTEPVILEIKQDIGFVDARSG